METHISKLGQSLRERREQLGLSQRRLAEKVGIRHTHVSRVERGESGVSLAVLARLAEVLQVSPQWLIGQLSCEAPAPKVHGDELSQDESLLVSLYRCLPKSDRRFLIRWLSALARQAKSTAVPGEGRWSAIDLAAIDATTAEARGGSGALSVGRQGNERAEAFSHAIGNRHGSIDHSPRNGDVVIVVVDDGDVMTRIWKPHDNGTIELAAMGSAEKSLVVDRDRVRVEAVLPSVWREASDQ